MTKQLIIDEYGNIKLVHEYKILKQEDLLSEASILFPYIIYKNEIYPQIKTNSNGNSIPFYGMVDSKKIVTVLTTNSIFLNTYFGGIDDPEYYPTFDPANKESIMLGKEYFSFIKGFKFIYMIEHHNSNKDTILWDKGSKSLQVFMYYGNEDEVYGLPLPNTFTDNHICIGTDKFENFNINAIYNSLQSSIWNMDLITDERKTKARTLFALRKRKSYEPEQVYIQYDCSNLRRNEIDLRNNLIKINKTEADRVKRYLKILKYNDSIKRKPTQSDEESD